MNQELPGQDAGIVRSPLLTKTATWPGGVRRGRRDEPAACAAGPFEHLSARFRVVRRMLGEPSFREVAFRYIASEPVPIPTPAGYGAGFPRFIRAQGRGGSFDYVADIAELEMAVTRARDAAHSVSFCREVLSAMPAATLAGARVLLHPSLGLVPSRFPIVSIWACMCRRARTIKCWRPEAALVAKSFRRVAVMRLPAGGYPFLQALAQGQTIGHAAHIASAAEPAFALTPNLALLEQAGAVTGLQRSVRRHAGRTS